MGLGFGQEWVLGLGLGFRDKVEVGFDFIKGVEFQGWGWVSGPREGASFMVEVRFRKLDPECDPET